MSRPKVNNGVVVPLLTVLLGVDIRYLIGASLVSVIAMSSGAMAAYVKERYTNIRIGSPGGRDAQRPLHSAALPRQSLSRSNPWAKLDLLLGSGTCLAQQAEA